MGRTLPNFLVRSAWVRMLHYRKKPEAAYVHWIKRLIPPHGKQRPRDLSAPRSPSFYPARRLPIRQHATGLSARA
jgi:hypothetical protein